MLATLAYLALALAVFAAVGAPTVGRGRPDGVSLGQCVVAGVLTLGRLEERRRSVLLPTRETRLRG